MAIMAPNITTRTRSTSVSSVLVNHAYAAHARPPHQGQQQQPLRASAPRWLICNQLGDLGDGEDEDQVEEQLQRGHPLVRTVWRVGCRA